MARITDISYFTGEHSFPFVIKHALFVLFMCVFILVGCTKNPLNRTVIPPESGSLSLNFDVTSAPENVAMVVAYLSREGEDTLSLVLSVSDQTAEGSFFNLSAGEWNLLVNALDVSGTVVYTGSAVVTILSGQTTVVNLTLQAATGNLEIHVTWGDANYPFTSFIRYSLNPVLSIDDGWESQYVLAPTIIKEDNLYKMWYAGFDGSKYQIGYTTSPDGISWNKYEGNPVLSPDSTSSYDSKHVSYPCVLRIGDIYYMYYSGYNYEHWQICLALSSDGINWEKYEGNPVLGIGVNGIWDNDAVFAPFVLYENGIYKMWYTERTTYSVIGYAESIDGIEWEVVNDPVLRESDSGFDSGSLGVPCILNYNNEYVMFYTGGPADNPQNQHIGFAYSMDGISWTRYSSNPIFSPNSGNYFAWDSYRVSGPWVLPDGNGYKMWYYGTPNWNEWQIGLAVSN